jgi:hypothetical protein
MIFAGEKPALYAPKEWYLIFGTRTKWWLRLLVPGKFKHVFAVGFVAEAGVWVCYEVDLTGNRIGVAKPGAAFVKWLALAFTNTEVLRMPPGTAQRRPWFTFWCVPAVASLLALDTGALWPDQLWRYCLANGAEIVADGLFDAGNRNAIGRADG